MTAGKSGRATRRPRPRPEAAPPGPPGTWQIHSPPGCRNSGGEGFLSSPFSFHQRTVPVKVVGDSTRCRQTAPPAATSCSATPSASRSARTPPRRGVFRWRPASLPRVSAAGGDGVAAAPWPGADQLAERAGLRSNSCRSGRCKPGRTPARPRRRWKRLTPPHSAPTDWAQTSATGGSCGPHR